MEDEARRLNIDRTLPLFDVSIVTISGCGLRLHSVSSIVVEGRVANTV